MITPRVPHDKKDEQKKLSPVPDAIELDDAMIKLQDEAAANLEGWKRAKADLENYRKRVAADTQATSKRAKKEFLLDLLPVADNFDRAFQSLTPNQKNEPLAKGFEYIKVQLNDFLRGMGAHRMEAVGKKFDPSIHEAVDTVPGEKEIVIEQILPGYMFDHEELLRPAQVKVGNGEEKK